MKLSKSGLKKLVGRMSMSVHDAAQLPSKVHGLIFTVSLLVSTHAAANTGGITTFFTRWKTTMENFISFISFAGMAVGVAAVLYGIVNMIKKGMGRGDDMEWSKILWPILGGALATIALLVLESVVTESGVATQRMGGTRSGGTQ